MCSADRPPWLGQSPIVPYTFVASTTFSRRPSALREPAPEDLFGDALALLPAIDVGGVEEVDPQLQGAVHDRVRVGLGRLVAEVHGAEAQPADAQAGASELDVINRHRATVPRRTRRVGPAHHSAVMSRNRPSAKVTRKTAPLPTGGSTTPSAACAKVRMAPPCDTTRAGASAARRRNLVHRLQHPRDDGLLRFRARRGRSDGRPGSAPTPRGTARRTPRG